MATPDPEHVLRNVASSLWVARRQLVDLAASGTAGLPAGELRLLIDQIEDLALQVGAAESAQRGAVL